MERLIEMTATKRTRAWYASLTEWKTCDCPGCCNLALVLRARFPELGELLTGLGVAPLCWTEAVHKRGRRPGTVASEVRYLICAPANGERYDREFTAGDGWTVELRREWNPGHDFPKPAAQLILRHPQLPWLLRTKNPYDR